MIPFACLRRLWSLTLVLHLAAACQASEVTMLDAADGDLVIFATLDLDTAQPPKLRIATMGASVPPVSRASHEALLIWVLPQASIVDATGIPLSQGEFRVTTEPSGSCEFCPSQSEFAPQILADGATCALPAWLAPPTEVSDRLVPRPAIERAAAAIRFERDGKCACNRLEPTVAGNVVDPRYLDIRPDPEPIERVAITDGDTATLIGQRVLVRVEADGTRTTRRRRQPGDPCGPPGVPFTDHTMAAADVGDGYTLVASYRDDTTESFTRYDVFDADLNLHAEFEFDRLPIFRPFVMRPISGGRVVLAGHMNVGLYQSRATLAVCSVDGTRDAIQCPEELTAEAESPLIDVREIGQSDWLITATATGSFHFGAPKPQGSSRTWHHVVRDPDYPRSALAAPGVQATTRISSVTRLFVSGDRAFACAQTAYGRSAVMTASVTPADLRSTAGPAWRIVSTEPSRCGLFMPLGGAGGVARLLGDDVALDFGADGRVVQRHTNVQSRLRLSRRATPIGRTRDAVLMLTADGAVLRHDGDLSSGAAPSLIYGPPNGVRMPKFGAAETSGDGRVWVFDDEAHVTMVRPAVPETPDRVRLAGFRAGDLPLAASFDPDTHRFLVAGVTAEGVGWLRWVGLDLQSDAVQLATAVIVDVAVIAPGVGVAITEDTRLLVVREMTSEAIAVRWDDPITEVQEAPPDARCCRRPSLRHPIALTVRCDLAPREDLFRAVDAAAGVAVVTGCDGLILRVAPTAEGLVATRFASDRQTPKAAESLGGRRPALTAVKVACPDDVLVMDAVGTHDLKFAEAGFQLAPDADGTLNLHDWAGNESSNIPVTNHIGVPVHVVGLRPGVTAVWTGGYAEHSIVHRYLGGARQRFGTFIYAAAQTEAGDAVLAGDHGRLIINRQCDR